MPSRIRRRASSTRACRRTTRRCLPSQGRACEHHDRRGARGRTGRKEREAKAALSPCIQLGTFQAGGADGDEDDLLAWYAHCRLPNMTGCRGASACARSFPFPAGRSTACSTSSCRSPSATSTFPSTRRAPEDEAWTDRLVRKLLHAPGSPNVAERTLLVLK